VSALPARGPAASRAVPGSIAAAQWAQIRAAAPQVTATIQRYLQRLGVFLELLADRVRSSAVLLREDELRRLLLASKRGGRPGAA